MPEKRVFPLRDLHVNGVSYAAFLIEQGSREHVELRPLDDSGNEEPYGHASSLLDDHDFDYYAGDGLFQAAVDTAKVIASEIGAEYTRRSWLTGKLERIETPLSWRDHLNGKPISNGDQLQLLDERGEWRWARYETARGTVYLHLENSVLEHSPGMTLRWPV
jgi:hypothetical protein